MGDAPNTPNSSTSAQHANEALEQGSFGDEGLPLVLSLNYYLKSDLFVRRREDLRDFPPHRRWIVPKSPSVEGADPFMLKILEASAHDSRCRIDCVVTFYERGLEENLGKAPERGEELSQASSWVI